MATRQDFELAFKLLIGLILTACVAADDTSSLPAKQQPAPPRTAPLLKVPL